MTEPLSHNDISQKARNYLIFSALRAALGILWLLLAISVWSPGFATHMSEYTQDAFQKTTWLTPWFGTWVSLIAPAPGLWVALARILTPLMAFCLLFGFARKTAYITGIIITLPLWTLMEGYAPTQAFGVINLGLAISYILFFLSLLLINHVNGTTPHSLDFYIGKRIPWWKHVSEFSNINVVEEEALVIPWGERIPIIIAVVGVLALLIGTSVISGHVGPIQIGSATRTSATVVSSISKDPVAKPHDAVLPPLLGTGDVVDIKLVATNKTVEIASGVQFNGWTYNDTIPAPTIHVRQGQTINVSVTNKGTMLHSIDFHSAMIAHNPAYEDIPKGETKTFTMKAEVPGIFIYHCGTPPVLEHMAMGMYGAIIVDPKVPLPPADVSYVLVQSEFYTKPGVGGALDGDLNKMQNRLPDLVAFNGVAFQYKDHPLPVKVGKRVRIYFVNDGVTQWSAFHVIGGIFDKVYPSGDANDALTGVSTYSVAPGEGIVFDIIFPMAGVYPVVDHNMANMGIGAMGVFSAGKTSGTVMTGH
jgi:nitrite reductase (NO-forming)